MGLVELTRLASQKTPPVLPTPVPSAGITMDATSSSFYYYFFNVHLRDQTQGTCAGKLPYHLRPLFSLHQCVVKVP